MASGRTDIRRERTLAKAAELFAVSGYHGAGMDEIGEAVGITGPAIYRYFANKQAILDAICLEGMRSVVEGATTILAEGGSPRELLARLVHMRVDFAFGPHRLAFPIHRNEEANLSLHVRRQIDEMNGLYRAEWMRVLSAVLPDSATSELHVAFLAAHVLIGYTAFNEITVEPKILKPHLERMATAVLLS